MSGYGPGGREIGSGAIRGTERFTVPSQELYAGYPGFFQMARISCGAEAQSLMCTEVCLLRTVRRLRVRFAVDNGGDQAYLVLPMGHDPSE